MHTGDAQAAFHTHALQPRHREWSEARLAQPRPLDATIRVRGSIIVKAFSSCAVWQIGSSTLCLLVKMNSDREAPTAQTEQLVSPSKVKERRQRPDTHSYYASECPGIVHSDYSTCPTQARWHLAASDDRPACLWDYYNLWLPSINVPSADGRFPRVVSLSFFSFSSLSPQAQALGQRVVPFTHVFTRILWPGQCSAVEGDGATLIRGGRLSQRPSVRNWGRRERYSERTARAGLFTERVQRGQSGGRQAGLA